MMSFANAIDALDQGLRLTRAGWTVGAFIYRSGNTIMQFDGTATTAAWAPLLADIVAMDWEVVR